MARQTAFLARPCAAAVMALSTRLCGGPHYLLLDSYREMTELSLSPLHESHLSDNQATVLEF